jgi:hypothetical protein
MCAGAAAPLVGIVGATVGFYFGSDSRRNVSAMTRMER